MRRQCEPGFHWIDAIVGAAAALATTLLALEVVLCDQTAGATANHEALS